MASLLRFPALSPPAPVVPAARGAPVPAGVSTPALILDAAAFARNCALLAARLAAADASTSVAVRPHAKAHRSAAVAAAPFPAPAARPLQVAWPVGGASPLSPAAGGGTGGTGGMVADGGRLSEAAELDGGDALSNFPLSSLARTVIV